MSSQPTTIADLARSLKLSKSAVSNALNDRPGVSASTRARVREAAEASGWRPNALARALSTGRARAFGLCIARDSGVLGSESYYQRVIAGIEEVLIDGDQSLLLRLVGTGGGDLDVYRQWAAERRVDAVALFDLHADDPRLALVDELGLPAVIQGSVGGDGLAGVHPVVNGDVEAEAALIADHLRDRGVGRVVFLHGPTGFTHELDRLAAVRDVCAAHHLALRTVETDYSQEAGHHQGRDLLTDGWADAVVTSNDLLAVGVSRAATESADLPALDLPGTQIRIVSWDDSLLCRYLRPGITALDRHPHDVGREVGRALICAARGEVATPEATPVSLVVRESTAG